MRSSGLVTSVAGLGPSDHLCACYASAAQRGGTVVAWLGDGLGIGQRAVYVGHRPVPELIADLGPLPGRDALLASGSLQVHALTEVYDLTRPLDAMAQLRMYDDAVQQALEDGFDGLRVAADITRLVADPRRRPGHLRWEVLADRYTSRRPLAPLCLYDATLVGDLDAIACAHPLRSADVPAPAFALYSAEGAPVLAGEIDGVAAAVLQDVLSALPLARDREVLDVAPLEFLGGRAAFVLQDELARRRARGHDLVLSGARPALRRLWELCDFDMSHLAA